MPEPFDPLEYLAYLRTRWKFAAAATGAAAAITLVACWILPPRYTATATLVIEPPAASDPRAATAVSPIYLESLKTYEEFASSDSLFAKAVEKYRLAPPGSDAVENLKRRVLSVNKPKETKVLAIEVTLLDPKQSQAVAQYLAEETVALSRSIARAGETDARADLDKQLDRARAQLEEARNALAVVEASGSAAAMDEEVRSIAELKSRTTEQMIAANAFLAELTARQGAADDVASTRARIAALTVERSALDRDSSAKAAALAALRARLGRADDQVRVARATYDTLSARANELSATGGMRTEQIRIVDPGVVPQRPSFPRPALYTISAFAIALVLSLSFLTLQFGLSRQRAQPVRPSFKVARG